VPAGALLACCVPLGIKPTLYKYNFMRFSILAGALLLAAGSTHAQTHPAYPYKTTEYLSKEGKALPGPEGAFQRIERTFRDSLSGAERVYNAAGKLMEMTPYADMEHRVKLGPRTTFYENGQLYTKADYVGANLQGEFVVYYLEGQVKRRETYEAGERKTEACFAKDGSPVPYFPFEVMPVYDKGGNDEIVRAVQMNVRYPVSALKNQEQGRVFVSFVVNATGGVENVQVVKGVSPALDGATVDAVKKLKPFTPGRLDGEPVAVSFTVPVTFKIQEAPRTVRPSSQQTRLRSVGASY